MISSYKSNIGLITIWHVTNRKKYYKNCYVPSIKEYLVLMAITPSTNTIYYQEKHTNLSPTYYVTT